MIICDLDHLEVVAEKSVVGGDKSSFQLTCFDIAIDNRGSQGVFLTANCRTRNGEFMNTELELQNIQNIDGTLLQF